MMEKTHYLTEEELNFTNYPAVAREWESIQELIRYNLEVHSAVSAYTEGKASKINLSEVDLRKYISLARRTLEIIGTATNVCFDVVMPLREIQYNMQEILYGKNAFGSLYVGAPGAVAEEGL